MEASTLTPLMVARIVLKAQEQALSREARSCALYKSSAQMYIPYEKMEAEMSVNTTQSGSLGTTIVADEREEGEIIEKEDEDTDTLSTNASSPHSSLTPPSSSYTSTTPLACLPQKPLLTNDLCRIFTSTGSCTAICPYAHDPTKIALCNSRISKLPCVKIPTCRQNHIWTPNNAPSCANFMMNRCCVRGAGCGFAHNVKVFPWSTHCEAFSRLGYCELGGECSGIHWFNYFGVDVDHEMETSEDSMREEETDARLKAAKARFLLEKKARREAREAKEAREAEKARRTTFSGGMWAKEPEEFLTSSEANGDLALQEDFVPF